MLCGGVTMGGHKVRVAWPAEIGGDNQDAYVRMIALYLM